MVATNNPLPEALAVALILEENLPSQSSCFSAEALKI
jgi:hypothetical protein